MKTCQLVPLSLSLSLSAAPTRIGNAPTLSNPAQLWSSGKRCPLQKVLLQSRQNPVMLCAIVAVHPGIEQRIFGAAMAAGWATGMFQVKSCRVARLNMRKRMCLCDGCYMKSERTARGAPSEAVKSAVDLLPRSNLPTFARVPRWSMAPPATISQSMDWYIIWAESLIDWKTRRAPRAGQGTSPPSLLEDDRTLPLPKSLALLQ